MRRWKINAGVEVRNRAYSRSKRPPVIDVWCYVFDPTATVLIRVDFWRSEVCKTRRQERIWLQ